LWKGDWALAKAQGRKAFFIIKNIGIDREKNSGMFPKRAYLGVRVTP